MACVEPIEKADRSRKNDWEDDSNDEMGSRKLVQDLEHCHACGLRDRDSWCAWRQVFDSEVFDGWVFGGGVLLFTVAGRIETTVRQKVRGNCLGRFD